MTAKQRLHELVELMDEDQAASLLEELEWSPATLTDEDRAAIDRGRAQARDGRSRSTEEVFERLRTRV